jgi:hypothetical protein
VRAIGESVRLYHAGIAAFDLTPTALNAVASHVEHPEEIDQYISEHAMLNETTDIQVLKPSRRDHTLAGFIDHDVDIAFAARLRRLGHDVLPRHEKQGYRSLNERSLGDTRATSFLHA